jgi:hypothetical protein
MIPLAWLKLVPWKAVGAGMAVVAVMAMGWRISVWKDAHEALPGVRDALEREEACLDGSKCYDRVAALTVRQEQITADTVAGYEKELEDLRNRPVPTRVIRVCRQGSPGNVRDAPGPGGTATAPGTGLVLGSDEFDTGPLRELARQADEVAAAYRALRARDEALAAPQNTSTQPSR